MTATAVAAAASATTATPTALLLLLLLLLPMLLPSHCHDDDGVQRSLREDQGQHDWNGGISGGGDEDGDDARMTTTAGLVLNLCEIGRYQDRQNFPDCQKACEQRRGWARLKSRPGFRVFLPESTSENAQRQRL